MNDEDSLLRSLTHIKMTEGIMTTLSLFFFLATYDSVNEPVYHSLFFTFIHYPFCIIHWIIMFSTLME